MDEATLLIVMGLWGDSKGFGGLYKTKAPVLILYGRAEIRNRTRAGADNRR